MNFNSPQEICFVKILAFWPAEGAKMSKKGWKWIKMQKTSNNHSIWFTDFVFETFEKKKGLIIGCRHKKAQNNITHHQQSYHYPTKHAITTCYGTKVWIYTFWMGFVCFLKILMFHRIFHSGISPKSFWRGHFLNFLPGCGTSEFSLCLGRTWLEGELKIYLFIMGECNFETLIFFFRKSKIFSSFHVFLAIIDLIFSFLLFSDSSGFIFFTSDHLQGDLQGIAF